MRRFTETQRVEEEWFCDLSLAWRCLFDFIWAKADCAGVWSVNKRNAEAYLGEKVEWPKFVAACGGRVIEMEGGRYYLRDFVRTNCGELSKDCKAHKPIFKKLAEHGIHSYPVATKKLQETDTEQEEEKEWKETEETTTPSLEEVIAYGQSPQGNVPANVAEIWWNEHEARPRHSSGDYTDKSELRVMDWKAALRGYGLKWRNNDHRNGNGKPAAPKPRAPKFETEEMRMLREAAGK